MNKKLLTTVIIVGVILVAGIVYLLFGLHEQRQMNAELQELAALDKAEMESEYQQFADQYTEMRSQITNDSLIEQLTAEQLRTQELLQELKEVKATDAREIARLKKELETCRAVIRSYVYEIDSLNRLNQNLIAENTQVKEQVAEANRTIEGLSTERATLSEKVAIAAQLDATGIGLSLLDKRGKATTKIAKCKTLQVNFSIAKNVTAVSGSKTVYVRVTSPSGTLLGNAGTFAYEDRTLVATAKKTVEYGGKETAVTLYWNVTQALEAGSYNVSIFADGNMIGSRAFTFK
ncbi:MAG: hypothetical protein LUI08_03270 [Prevotella sp.]|nr:hypothetical protein [Prevotella sp.]MCD8289544.1 hypothetical protein [Prevotella sp.]MCD8306401.1 hypothetical protein [Prevotella sp.]